MCVIGGHELSGAEGGEGESVECETMERKLIGLKGENVRVSTKALVIDVHLRHRQIGGRGQLMNVKKGKKKIQKLSF